METTVVDGRPGEREVEVREVKTDEKEGSAAPRSNWRRGTVISSAPKEKIAFGNPITRTHDSFVSDDRDRPLADFGGSSHVSTRRYGGGARPLARSPTLALVTFQGRANFSTNRLVRLTTVTTGCSCPGCEAGPEISAWKSA